MCSNLCAPTLDILFEAEQHLGSVLVTTNWCLLVMPSFTGLFLKHCQMPPWSTTKTVLSDVASCSPFLSSKIIPRCTYFLVSGGTVIAADTLFIATGFVFLCLRSEWSLSYHYFASHFVFPVGSMPAGMGLKSFWIRSRDKCCSVCKHFKAKISRSQKNHL